MWIVADEIFFASTVTSRRKTRVPGGALAAGFPSGYQIQRAAPSRRSADPVPPRESARGRSAPRRTRALPLPHRRPRPTSPAPALDLAVAGGMTAQARRLSWRRTDHCRAGLDQFADVLQQPRRHRLRSRQDQHAVARTRCQDDATSLMLAPANHSGAKPTKLYSRRSGSLPMRAESGARKRAARLPSPDTRCPPPRFPAATETDSVQGNGDTRAPGPTRTASGPNGRRTGPSSSPAAGSSHGW